MKIKKDTLLGKIPLTKKELYYLAKNHEKYDLTKINTDNIIINNENGFNNIYGIINQMLNSNGEFVRVKKYTLLGKVPVTEKELYYLSEKHEDYDLTKLDTSQITNMNNLFSLPSRTIVYNGKQIFNQNISSWNVSNVTDMSCMFRENKHFNQPLNSWDVSNVINMSRMFQSSVFDQPLNSWDTSNVTDMSCMFGENKHFNQPLNSWDVSSVTSMHDMFGFSKYFNQPLYSWNVSNVEDMECMFEENLDYKYNIEFVKKSKANLEYVIGYHDELNGLTFKEHNEKYTIYNAIILKDKIVAYKINKTDKTLYDLKKYMKKYKEYNKEDFEIAIKSI